MFSFLMAGRGQEEESWWVSLVRLYMQIESVSFIGINFLGVPANLNMSSDCWKVLLVKGHFDRLSSFGVVLAYIEINLPGCFWSTF